MKKQNKSKMSVSNRVLICSIVAVILFTIAAIILQFYNGTEISSTLTEKWFSFWTVEILVLSGIKATKVVKGYKKIEDTYEEIKEDFSDSYDEENEEYNEETYEEEE